MTLTAASVPEVIANLATAAKDGVRITEFALPQMNRVLEYTPEDMTVTVEAGITLAALQQRLAERGQWLPIDPPCPESLSIGALLAGNKSGPRRYGYGTIREHLLGIKVVLSDGRVIKAGGKVVKNVAGYDLCKLFVGSRGTLGVIVEAAFKVLPRPEKEEFVQASGAKLDALRPLTASELAPVVLDLHNQEQDTPTLVVGFAGSREDVDWRLGQARQIGLLEPATLEYEEKFWGEAQEPHRVSVLPSKLLDTLRDLEASFVARAGNGMIYYRGAQAPEKPRLPGELLRRIKDTYDPRHLLPDLPW
ncbi:MAG: FAD-binding oxidoreductase [Verrucomicrobia subdivision 3 bacterium]|nr:FAD-binding oxidoreductase [Limisphaerales bacterium]